MFQVCQLCISLHIIHSSQIQKCTVIGLDIPRTHATRWLASVLIVFPKRLADFMKKMKFCTIPTWTKSSFLHRNSKLVILTTYPKSLIDLMFCQTIITQFSLLLAINFGVPNIILNLILNTQDKF